ncbi:MAG: type I phosphomannose isomerase catalytic subunit [Candidatus Nanopelagicales bacterium]
MRIITGQPRYYDWGQVNGLQPWTGVATGGPEAELWFHDSEADPNDFNPLVKILAVGRPLSLQVHPDADGIALLRATDRGHLLNDDVVKSEAVLAITPFTALAGFRDPGDAASLLNIAGTPTAAAFAASGDWSAAVTAILSTTISASAVKNAASTLPEEQGRVIGRIASLWPNDPAVALALMLRIHLLDPGDALAVPAGVLHCYIEGLGVEAMPAGDNVLRGGLTTKVVDVHATVDALRANLVPHHRTARWHEPLRQMPFDMRLAEGTIELLSEASVVLPLSGSVTIEAPNSRVMVHAGQACAVEGKASVAQDAEVGNAVLVTKADA